MKPAFWEKLAARERFLIVAAAAVIAAALLWQVGLRPAVRTLRAAPAQRAELDAQLQHMHALQSQAEALQREAGQDAAQARKAVEDASAKLGDAGRLRTDGDRATLTLKDVDAQHLATWLQEARVNAHALPEEARLRRDENAQLSGTVTLTLPGD